MLRLREKRALGRKCWEIDEDARERCLEVYKGEKRKLKRYIYRSKKEIQEQCRRKMNQDVNENKNLL